MYNTDTGTDMYRYRHTDIHTDNDKTDRHIHTYIHATCTIVWEHFTIGCFHVKKFGTILLSLGYPMKIF